MLEYLSEFSEKSTKVLQFIGLLLTIVISIFVSVNKALDIKLSQTEKRINNFIIAKTAPLEEYVYSQIVSHINKEYDCLMILNEKVNERDVRTIIKNWRIIPEDYKTDDLRLKYQQLLNWYVTKK